MSSLESESDSESLKPCIMGLRLEAEGRERQLVVCGDFSRSVSSTLARFSYDKCLVGAVAGMERNEGWASETERTYEY